MIQEAIFQGILAGLGLILMIGSQDIFVLRQGIRNNHVFLITTISVLADALLVVLGVNGLATLIQKTPFWQDALIIAGSLFLFGYGLFAFYEVYQTKIMKINFHKEGGPRKWWRVAILALTFNLLNPHAWLDAAVILGSLGSKLPTAAEHHAFSLGAIAVITIWFYFLAYAAKWLAPMLSKPRVWQVINFFAGCVMWAIALVLVMDYWV